MLIKYKTYEYTRRVSYIPNLLLQVTIDCVDSTSTKYVRYTKIFVIENTNRGNRQWLEQNGAQCFASIISAIFANEKSARTEVLCAIWSQRSLALGRADERYCTRGDANAESYGDHSSKMKSIKNPNHNRKQKQTSVAIAML